MKTLVLSDDYLIQKRRINLICTVILIIAFMYFVIMPGARAWFWDPVVDFFTSQKLGWVRDLLDFAVLAPMWMVHAMVYGQDILNPGKTGAAQGLNEFFNGVITGTETTREQIYDSVSHTYIYINHTHANSLYGAFSSFTNILKIVAAFMLIIFAASRIFANMEKGMDGSQALMKFLAEIGISGVFIIFADKILGALAGIGVEMIRSITADASNTTQIVDNIMIGLFGKASGTVGLGTLIGGVIKSIIPVILSILVFLAAGLAVIQTCLEILLRRLFAPLAIVDIYQEGLRSPGARYIKKFFATFIKFMIIAVVARLVPTLMGYLAGEGGTFAQNNVILYLVLIITINFSAIGVMFKGGEIANDVVGA